MIKLQAVHKTYQTKHKAVEALKSINLELPDKGLVFVHGKSGCGKSTLLHLLGGLDAPTSGQILIDNQDLTKLKPKQLDDYRNQAVGFVFQNFQLIPHFTILENILLSFDLQGIKHTDIQTVLERLELTGLEQRYPNQLSGGQQQRVAIARALIKKPRLILADEPTGNLDSKTSTSILTLLKDISKDCLVIVVSHDIEFAQTFADELIEMSDGEIIRSIETAQDSPKAELILPKSKGLNLKTAAKLGIHNFMIKMKRTILTLLLNSIALTFFSMAFMLYQMDIATVSAQTRLDQNLVFSYLKSQTGEKMTFAEMRAFMTTHDHYQYSVTYNVEGLITYNNFPTLWSEDDDIRYVTGPIRFVQIDENNQPFYEKYLTTNSRLPNAIDEVLITNVYAKAFITLGYRVNEYGNTMTISTPEDMIGKTLWFDDHQVTVVGILQHKIETYDSLNSNEPNHTYQSFYEKGRISSDFQESRQYAYGDVVVHQNFISSLNNYDQRAQFELQVMLPDTISNITKQSEYFESLGYLLFNPLEIHLSNLAGVKDQIQISLLVVSIVFVGFSMLLLYQFIQISIQNQKQEMGILRALGASKNDLYKIYLSESLVLALAISLVSILLSFVGMFVLNRYVFNLYPYFNMGQPYQIQVISYHWMTPFVLILIIVLTTLISVLKPIRRLAKTKPIDVIRSI